ncbi:MAG: hypothetical protein SFY81_03390, partial [Verrucomicrobiota bacterium]|nr:hypothetical protein [Verrucomicrobiota bacterium]
LIWCSVVVIGLGTAPVGHGHGHGVDRRLVFFVVVVGWRVAVLESSGGPSNELPWRRDQRGLVPGP